MPTSRPVNQEDLKAVRGIGRKVEARLNEAGIRDLWQLARTPVNEPAAILAGLRGRFDVEMGLHDQMSSSIFFHCEFRKRA